MFRIAIIGRSEWTYLTMQRLQEAGYSIPLVITSNGAPEYRFQKHDFENFALKHNAQYHYDPKISAETLKGLLEKTGPIDIAVSINYSGVISQEVIDLFPQGILNAHGGDLPRYRGNACQAWAIINNEEKIGLCIHKMIGGELDSGDIIARKYYPVSHDTRIGEVYDCFDKDIPALMTDAIKALEANSNYFLQRQSKDFSDALRCYPRMPEDGRIHWEKSNVEILRLINASSEPYAGAFGRLNDNIFRIWRAEILEDNENYLAVPGQVSFIDKTNGFVTVITGKGKLLLKETEFEGTRSVPSKFISSIRTRIK